MKIKVLEYSIHNRWQISKSVTVIVYIFCAIYLTVAEMLSFEIVDLENADKGHGV